MSARRGQGCQLPIPVVSNGPPRPMPAPRLLTPGLGEMLVVRPQHVRRREVERLTSSLQPGKAHRFRRSRCGRRGDPVHVRLQSGRKHPFDGHLACSSRRRQAASASSPRPRSLAGAEVAPASTFPGNCATGRRERGARRDRGIGRGLHGAGEHFASETRGFMEGASNRGSWRRRPSWPSAACAAPGWDCGHEACAGVPECFSFLCSAACIPSNDSFTMAPHPDVGEGAGPLPVRPGRAFYLPVPESPR